MTISLLHSGTFCSLIIIQQNVQYMYYYEYIQYSREYYVVFLCIRRVKSNIYLAIQCTHVFLCIFPPVDHSRVVLSIPDENGSDYINASYIDVSTILIMSHNI